MKILRLLTSFNSRKEAPKGLVVGGAKQLQHLQLGRGARSWLADVHPAEALLSTLKLIKASSQ